MALVRSRMQLPTGLLVVMVFLCASTLLQSAHGDKAKHKQISYFVHESFAGPNASVVPVAGPNNNLTAGLFGMTSAFDNPITLEADSNADVIGFATGLATATKQPRVVEVSVTHTINSTVLGSGSLVFGGILNFNNPASEVVVSGGTGTYRFYRGIATIQLIYSNGPYNMYKYTAKLVEP